ncbi:hypothetical protein Vretifemale_17915 [Volvox reticuliferus]|uniref:Uncharacterized protein n=1 Tax=Volvox reticuliferus TaxID=1737510 RepID=A0A8J4CUR4_9CHLO|nr:hypothetical protein Vretifemale_17915 [Volvox reticuliferus]
MRSFHGSARVAATTNERPFTNARPLKRHVHVVKRTVKRNLNQVDAEFWKAESDSNGADVERDDSRRVFGRRGAMLAISGMLTCLSTAVVLPERAQADDFVTLPSGIKVLTIREGEGARPQPGDTVEVHWAGFTKGYQAYRQYECPGRAIRIQAGRRPGHQGV